MDRATDITPAIEAAITTALATIAPEAKNVGPTTRLMGSRAVVDSIGFVSLLVSLEQLLPVRVDLVSSYMKQPDGDEAGNPFDAVGSLTSHIRALVEQRL